MIEQLNKCNICPQGCNINRNDGQIGRCKSSNKIKIALYNTHYFEEPCISGENGVFQIIWKIEKMYYHG